MYILAHLIIIFIFVFTLLMINIPHIERNNYIMMKLYLFVGIFIFEFIIGIITTLIRRCIIDISKITRSSLQTALVAVVAYSIYNDLEWSANPFIASLNTPVKQNLAISVIIIAFVTIGYFIEMIFTSNVPGINDCLNNIYPPKIV